MTDPDKPDINARHHADDAIPPGTLALVVNCGFCWAVPGTACTDVGQHYARYLRAYRRGLLNAADLATVSAAAAHITAGTIVPEVQSVTYRSR
jgi:hypothetical protein